jgi:glutamate racemase
VQDKEQPVGVLDSGLGGLTVVRELERLLPHESVIYFGDNANCPYGNRSKDEILKLTFAMLDFLQIQEVKIVAIACNTISTLIDELRKPYRFPIVSIVEAACEYVAHRTAPDKTAVGVFATEFTIKQGSHAKLLKNLRPEFEVFGVPSRTLAALVDEGRFDDPAITAEVSTMLDNMKKVNPDLSQIVLGCTHYTIIQGTFEQAAPGIKFINPTLGQAEKVKALLSEMDLLSDTTEPALNIYTSGAKTQYEGALKKLEIKRPYNLSVIK